MKTGDIIQCWLLENGYDGLCNPENECGCPIFDLFPCGEIQQDCVAGHKRMKDDGDWEIVDGKDD